METPDIFFELQSRLTIKLIYFTRLINIRLGRSARHALVTGSVFSSNLSPVHLPIYDLGSSFTAVWTSPVEIKEFGEYSS